ncbi:MAG: type II toxin-antitoxin system RelE/ParE family toxin [Rhodoplanes sp.]
MRRIVILPGARRDLIEIGDFIALDNPERALSFVAEIEAKMTAIAERPDRFPATPCGAAGSALRTLSDLLPGSRRRSTDRQGAARCARSAAHVRSMIQKTRNLGSSYRH